MYQNSAHSSWRSLSQAFDPLQSELVMIYALGITHNLEPEILEISYVSLLLEPQLSGTHFLLLLHLKFLVEFISFTNSHLRKGILRYIFWDLELVRTHTLIPDWLACLHSLLAFENQNYSASSALVTFVLLWKLIRPGFCFDICLF